MSLIKFLLGQRKRWRPEAKQELPRPVFRVDLADPLQRRDLMNCIAFSPGIPSDEEQRFVSFWQDDSLTLSEACTSENVVTVVEVHAPEDTTLDEGADELDDEQGRLEDIEEAFEEEEESQKEERLGEQEEEGESKGNTEELALPAEEEKEKDQRPADNNAVHVKAEESGGDLKQGVLTKELNLAENQENSGPREGDEGIHKSEKRTEAAVKPIESSTIVGEEELPDQQVPELPGSGSSSSRSTNLTTASSIEMQTQTDLLPAPRETETQTEEPPAQVVSLRPKEMHGMRLLSVALEELGGDSGKPPSSSCSCSENLRPGPSSPNLCFTAEKNREIARENAILLSRLQRAHARIRKPPSPLGPPESSSSINRRKQQERIQRENLILLRKISAARGKGRGRETLLSYC